MKSVNAVALAALLSTGALAVPTLGHQHAPAHAKLHHKRDVVWVTETDVEVVTIVKTVFADGSVPTGTAYSHHRHTGSVTTVTPYSATLAAPSSSSETESETETETETSSATAAYTAPSSTIVASTTSIAAPEPTTTSTYEAPATEPTTTSTYEAPAPETTTTSAYQAPAPTTIQTTTSAPAPTVYTTSSEAAAPSATATSGGASSYDGSGSATAGTGYTGDFTYYAPGMGACGITSTDSDAIIAISEDLFDLYTPDGNPNNNPLCGRTVSLITTDGSSQSATVVDRCVGCDMGSIDLSPSLFSTVSSGDMAAGRLTGMKWSWD